MLLFSLLLAACSRLQSASESTIPASPIAATSTVVLPATPSVDAQPTVTSSPTPEIPDPSIDVSEQRLDEDGQLLVDRVISPVEGWLVIQQEENGQAGEILAAVSIATGENRAVEIEVDPLTLGDGLFASLFVDEGQPGIFEYPGPDVPMTIESEPVSEYFTVEVQVITPRITVQDQDLGESGQVILNEVVAAASGWVGIHMDDKGQPGTMLAYAPIAEGRNEAVSLTLNWHEATPTLHVVLYEDAGKENVFENSSVDRSVSLQENVNFETFDALFPPDVFVIHQPVADGRVSVEQVTSFGPGWLVIYNDDEGELGNIIGQAPLEKGINKQIEVDVVESAATSILYIMLHEDLETEGTFDFPQSDPPVRYQERLPNPFDFRTDTGNYLITEDQELSDAETVTVSLVVVDVDAWIVIRGDESGEQNDIAGLAWVPAGITRNLEIEVDSQLITTTLYAILHLDGGGSQEFDYPEGLDIPLQRNRAIIQAPFFLLGELDNR